jgi:anti-sigma regulatory factor (Ser/Thr protein kinase)
VSASPTRRSSRHSRATSESAGQLSTGSSRELRVALPNHPRASRLARRELASFRADAGIHQTDYESLRLIVSELVSNAVRHARASRMQTIELRIACTKKRIRIEVDDHGRGFDAPRVLPMPRGAGGYGLFIVDKLCERWGVERGDCSVVWCELERANGRRLSDLQSSPR